MHISYIRPLLNYGRFILEEERKRKLVEVQAPKLLIPKLLFQRNYTILPIHNNLLEEQQNILSRQHSDKLEAAFDLNHNYQLINQEKVEKQEHNQNQTNQQDIYNSQQFLQKSIFTEQFAANCKIEDSTSVGILNSLNNSFIASVFDGHGGSTLAEYCSQKIIDVLDKILQIKLTQKHNRQNISQTIIESLKQAYQTIQDDFYQDIYLEQLNLNQNGKNNKLRNVGSCGITIVLYDDMIYVANCGDSQAIIISNKEQTDNHQYQKLNQRLSVNNPHQRNRLYIQYPDDQDILVEESKGCYYLKGRLQPTRTIGDFYMKKSKLWRGKSKFTKPYITCIPDVMVYKLNQMNKKIVIASDGIWDFMDKWSITKLSAINSQKANKNFAEVLVSQTLKKIAKMHSKNISEFLQISPQQKRSYHDDISVIVIQLEDYLKMLNKNQRRKKIQMVQQGFQKQPEEYTKQDNQPHQDFEDEQLLNNDWQQANQQECQAQQY